MSSITQTQIGQIKTMAAYLDPHVLLAFLKTHAPGTERVQEQIAEKTLISKKESWDKVEDEFKNNKLLSLLNNHHEYQRLRQEKGFTLERLNEDRGITMGDCKKVFQFAKMQYEMGKYKGKKLIAKSCLLIGNSVLNTPFE
jgi:beta-N-acetylglucosaminidase